MASVGDIVKVQRNCYVFADISDSSNCRYVHVIETFDNGSVRAIFNTEPSLNADGIDIGWHLHHTEYIQLEQLSGVDTTWQ